MPVYTYRCDNCGLQFERHQKYEEKSLTRCPECSKKALRKVISPVRVVFKGSGFYATDHKSPSGQKHSSHKKDEKSHKESSEKVEAKTESASSDSKPKESTPAKSGSDSAE